MKKNHQEPLTDLHYGSDEEMLAWCKREGLTPIKDAEGNWDWDKPWGEFLALINEEPPQS